MDGKNVRHFCRLFALAWFITSAMALPLASAAVIEVSGMLAYSTSDFNDGYHSLQRRYTGQIDFKFTAVSALEFEYTDSTTKVSYNTDLGGLLKNPTRQASTYHDQIYSFNWVQNLVSSKWILQPYFVIGGGRMTRKHSVELPHFAYRAESTQNVTTGTGGLGLRLFLTKSMAIKAEAKTYVPSFQFSKWKENQMLSVGLSLAF